MSFNDYMEITGREHMTECVRQLNGYIAANVELNLPAYANPGPIRLAMERAFRYGQASVGEASTEDSPSLSPASVDGAAVPAVEGVATSQESRAAATLECGYCLETFPETHVHVTEGMHETHAGYKQWYQVCPYCGSEELEEVK